ncbi:MAG: hypothetical protein HQK76_21145 [Desulfobacterales bacterium]|nr:hypothetical protein [Desulfobacterales bacterium]
MNNIIQSSINIYNPSPSLVKVNQESIKPINANTNIVNLEKLKTQINKSVSNPEDLIKSYNETNDISKGIRRTEIKDGEMIVSVYNQKGELIKEIPPGYVPLDKNSVNITI